MTVSLLMNRILFFSPNNNWEKRTETQNFCIKRSNGTTEHKHKCVKKYIIGWC